MTTITDTAVDPGSFPTLQAGMDVTPTWSGLMPALLELLQRTDTDAAIKADIADELTRFARIVDNVLAVLKANGEEAAQ